MKVRYTLPALADLETILDHITAHSPQGAVRVKARLKKFIDLLSQYPHIGTRTDAQGIRRLVITPFPYLIFYETSHDKEDEPEVIIHAIRRGARNPASMP